jgi:hypothetical protein
MKTNTFLAQANNKLQNRSLLLGKRVVQTLRNLGGPPPKKKVVFVGGVQRSGTNMIMDVLERSFETDVYHERDPRAFHEFEMRPPEVVYRLVEASNARFVVIKALCELQHLEALMSEFAPAMVLWMVRDYADTVNSHLRKWSGCPAAIGRIVSDREAAGWRGRGMSDTTHHVVTELYHPTMNDASAVALFWYFRNVLFFEQGFDTNDRVLAIRYESFVSDPERQCRRVFRFLGLDYSPRVIRKVFAGSIGTRGTPEIEPPIRDLCESLLARFDSILAASAAIPTGQDGGNASLYASDSA